MVIRSSGSKANHKRTALPNFRIPNCMKSAIAWYPFCCMVRRCSPIDVSLPRKACLDGLSTDVSRFAAAVARACTTHSKRCARASESMREGDGLSSGYNSASDSPIFLRIRAACRNAATLKPRSARRRFASAAVVFRRSTSTKCTIRSPLVVDGHRKMPPPASAERQNSLSCVMSSDSRRSHVPGAMRDSTPSSTAMRQTGASATCN
mmetsp:Transcript_112297/g.317409  ORF Transcript_112297/g.317409 Transcript_112297/m.317409 type:complete len:207 (+) Transcript_112297:1062-1682(+)